MKPLESQSRQSPKLIPLKGIPGEASDSDEKQVFMPMQ